ncbi:MAG: lipocalin family protein [Marinifilaceae bacterium]|jgi:hypothetical protein|nr:lipocalin family protein [Marinifilaceae bacterium]
MRKLLFLGLSVCLAFFVLSSCTKDKDEEEFPVKYLVGKWQVTHIEHEQGKMLDVTSLIGSLVFKPTFAIFEEDGTYKTEGEFGEIEGTFLIEGKTITCSFRGEDFLSYEVLSMTNENCELIMSMPNEEEQIHIKCKKVD